MNFIEQHVWSLVISIIGTGSIIAYINNNISDWAAKLFLMGFNYVTNIKVSDPSKKLVIMDIFYDMFKLVEMELVGVDMGPTRMMVVVSKLVAWLPVLRGHENELVVVLQKLYEAFKKDLDEEVNTLSGIVK